MKGKRPKQPSTNNPLYASTAPLSVAGELGVVRVRAALQLLSYKDMNTQDSETLEALLSEHSNAVLHVHFVDGEVYDLTGFHVFLEADGKYEECWADVVCHVQVPAKKTNWFADAGMSFKLNEVLEVSDTATGESLFRS